MCARRLCRRDYLIIARAFPAERNILFYRGVLYPCVLKNHPEILAQAFSRNVGDILAVDQYTSLVDVVKSHKKVDKRCFSASRLTDYRNLLPRRCRKIKSLYQRAAFIV